jgi:hypothetical protein
MEESMKNIVLSSVIVLILISFGCGETTAVSESTAIAHESAQAQALNFECISFNNSTNHECLDVRATYQAGNIKYLIFNAGKISLSMNKNLWIVVHNSSHDTKFIGRIIKPDTVGLSSMECGDGMSILYLSIDPEQSTLSGISQTCKSAPLGEKSFPIELRDADDNVLIVAIISYSLIE